MSGWLFGYWGLTPRRVRQEVAELRRMVVRLQDSLATEVLLSPGNPVENAARAARLVNSGWDGSVPSSQEVCYREPGDLA